MALSISYNASSLLLQPLPNLDISTRRTTNHALHRIKYVGALQPWTNFKADVANTYNAQTWNQQIIASKLTGNLLADSVDEERVFVSEERGVQGRLEARAGTALGAAFQAQQLDLKLGAFKGALPPYPGYKKPPDFVLKDQANMAKVVGKVKVPWILQHDLENIVLQFEAGNDDTPFRRVLGQIAEYMLELRLKYGVLTTYNQTIFLRKVDVGRAWGLEYSPVIRHRDRGSISGQTVSYCQSLYHVGVLARANSDFDTSTGMRNQRWTILL